jgi:hypothetical protein
MMQKCCYGNLLQRNRLEDGKGGERTILKYIFNKAIYYEDTNWIKVLGLNP